MRRHSLAVTLVAVLLAGCGQVAKPVMPKIVHVEVEKLVAVPPALTEPCPIARASDRSVEQVVAAYNANILSLQQCNNRMGEIRGLPGSGR